jgi:DNA polymerase III delta prime subunit
MNDAAQRLLQTAARGELHHALILHGPAHDDLRALSVSLAKALNCLNDTTGDDCTSCQRIDRRAHPDVHFIEVADEKKMISVEQIRELIAAATLRPYEGRTKVFIVDPVDAMSVGGANSILKTLEEPSRDTTFLLITRSPDLLLPTIRSRAQVVFIPGEAPYDEELARAITGGLRRFAEKNDGAALLAVAAVVASHDNVSQAMALLGSILCEAVATQRFPNLSAERLLAAADATMGGTRWLAVNADARMVVEQALAQLVVR